MVKINIQMEFDSKEEMLEVFGISIVYPQKHFGTRQLSDETKAKISTSMRASHANKKTDKKDTPLAPVYVSVLSDKEEDMAISDVGKHFTNSAKKSFIINRLRAYGLTEELADKVLTQMVRTGKLIQITPNTFRRPTLSMGKPKQRRQKYAIIKEFAKEVA